MLNFNNIIIEQGPNFIEMIFTIMFIVFIILFSLVFVTRMIKNGRPGAAYDILFFIPLLCITFKFVQMFTPIIYTAKIEVASRSDENNKAVSEALPKEFEIIDNKLYYKVPTLSSSSRFNDRRKKSYEKSFANSFDKIIAKIEKDTSIKKELKTANMLNFNYVVLKKDNSTINDSIGKIEVINIKKQT